MTLLRMAWRNLWRNPRRTIITVFSMSFGLTMMIVSYALMDGMISQMVHYATVLGSGHVQIHHPDYLEDHSLYDTIDEIGTVLSRVESTGVGNAAPRAFATALASSGDQSAGGMLWGIMPEREVKVTELDRHLASGRFLGPGERGGAVLGSNLAKNLAVSVGDEIIVLTQAADGSLGNAIYTVRGILKSVGEGLDRGGILLDMKDMDDLLWLKGQVHEVAIRLHDPDRLEEGTDRLVEALAGENLEVRNWRDLLPELDEYLRLSNTSTLIMLVIIFAVASLGIVNTQMMALFERTREIGVMRALGLSPWSVAALVFFETLFLLFLAAGAGAMAGSIWANHLEKYGMDMTSIGGTFSFLGVAFDPHLYARLHTSAITDSVLVMLAVSLAASVYPLFRATRITPADAIGRGR